MRSIKSIYIESDLIQKISKLAKSGKRSFSNQAAFLIEKGLTAEPEKYGEIRQ